MENRNIELKMCWYIEAGTQHGDGRKTYEIRTTGDVGLHKNILPI